MLQEKSALESTINRLARLEKTKDDMDEWLSLACEEEDQEVLESLAEQIAALRAALEEAEIALLLS